jgi:hypothetical protein
MSLNPNSNLVVRGLLLSTYLDEDAEVQRGEVTCPRSWEPSPIYLSEKLFLFLPETSRHKTALKRDTLW